MELDLFISDNLNLLRTGGAMTGTSGEVSRKYFRRVIISETNKSIVVISKFLKDKLTKQEFKAIYYHEVGHFVKGHNANCPLSVEVKELQADSYSASIVGPAVLLSALKKIPEIIRECRQLRITGTASISDEQYTKNIDIFLKKIDSKMTFRYEALKHQSLIANTIQK